MKLHEIDLFALAVLGNLQQIQHIQKSPPAPAPV